MSYYNPPSYNQRHLERPQNRSKMLTWYHLQKKSPLPWRNAPDVKPRPWKGWHYEDTGSGAKEWTAMVSEQGKHMFNETPWVSPVTVVAYERNPRVVSNESYYKRVQMQKQQGREMHAGMGLHGSNGIAGVNPLEMRSCKDMAGAIVTQHPLSARLRRGRTLPLGLGLNMMRMKYSTPQL